MNRFRSLIAVFAFSLLILGLPAIASAQWRNDRNNRNDDYNRNGRYNRNLQSTVKNLKNRSKQFARQIDRELDRSRYDDRRREDRINQLADSFRDAAENLDDEYDNRRDYNDSADEVRQVLSLGSQLDRAVSRARLSNNLNRDWNAIRQDLRILADAYNYNYNNRNNRNNRNDDYNNNRNRNRRSNNDWWKNIPFPN
ncbi:MAG: hypothetical protein H0W58_01650 [Acidobacteria bacterium]|nr:hypothetical protein [Acidobacteriota bacterium]